MCRLALELVPPSVEDVAPPVVVLPPVELVPPVVVVPPLAVVPPVEEVVPPVAVVPPVDVAPPVELAPPVPPVEVPSNVRALTCGRKSVPVAFAQKPKAAVCPGATVELNATGANTLPDCVAFHALETVD